METPRQGLIPADSVQLLIFDNRVHPHIEENGVSESIKEAE